MNVLFTTPLPVPYQVELFDDLAASGKVDVTVLYMWRTHADRTWDWPRLAHNHSVLSELSLAAAIDLLRGRELVVFSGYHPSQLRHLIAVRAKSREPWAFWGERPGFVLPNWLGRYYRQAVLPELGSPTTPIWGIGSWAVDAYRQEFGSRRKVINIPYFSKLDVFFDIDRTDAVAPPCRILFCGSLIKRKGVDLLLKAFISIAPEFPELELHLIGDGPMLEQLHIMSTPAAERVHFHGFKQRTELPAYYAAADVLCAPSRYDGWGLIIPEGLASGLLVVSTNRTGAALDLVDAQCGWVVQAGALDPLIEALRAAASTTGSARLARIARGRSMAMGQDVKAGVGRVLAAIEESLHCSATLSGQPVDS
jgi:glycosyltransferase involved in cell wall biosynthesis